MLDHAVVDSLIWCRTEEQFKVITYNQCSLQKANLHQVSYIPTKFAVLGKIIKLKKDDGTWDDGWHVVGVGSVTPEHLIPDSHDAIKAHRKRTGDANKKESIA